MFPLIRSTLRDQPDVARKMINGLLGPLAICDVSPAPYLYLINADGPGLMVSSLFPP